MTGYLPAFDLKWHSETPEGDDDKGRGSLEILAALF